MAKKGIAQITGSKVLKLGEVGHYHISKTYRPEDKAKISHAKWKLYVKENNNWFVKFYDSHPLGYGYYWVIKPIEIFEGIFENKKIEFDLYYNKRNFYSAYAKIRNNELR